MGKTDVVIREVATYILLVLFGIGTAYFGWQNHTKSDWVHPGAVDEQLDEQTRVFSAQIATERAIIDSLSVISDEARKRIEEQEERIQTLTTLAGRVRIVRDTVYVDKMVEAPAVDADTTITFEQTFTDSLFRVQSDIRFRDGMVSNRLDLEQMRDFRLDIAITENKGLVMTYVTSDDFDISEYRTLQLQPEQKRDTRAWWFAGGALTATLLYAIFN